MKKTPGSWMQTVQVEIAGGVPVFRSDPDPVMEQLKADPAWQGLRAVQNGELYAFPADFYGWDVPDPRWILGVTPPQLGWGPLAIYRHMRENTNRCDEDNPYGRT
jgi:hypothetical protein